MILLLVLLYTSSIHHVYGVQHNKEYEYITEDGQLFSAPKYDILLYSSVLGGINRLQYGGGGGEWMAEAYCRMWSTAEQYHSTTVV